MRKNYPKKKQSGKHFFFISFTLFLFTYFPNSNVKPKKYAPVKDSEDEDDDDEEEEEEEDSGKKSERKKLDMHFLIFT